MSSEHRLSPLDELLVIRCQLGERAAFSALYERWATPLARHLARVTGEGAAVDDLCQEVWLRVLGGLGRLREPARFRGWFFGIAHRVLMDRLRSRYAAPVDVALTDVELRESDDVDASWQATRELESGLAALTPIERGVIDLFYLQELSLSEIAETLGIPLGSVKSRLFRARAQLRRVLQPSGESHVG